MKYYINWDLYIFIRENAFENVVWKMVAILSRPQCVNTKPHDSYHIISTTVGFQFQLTIFDHCSWYNFTTSFTWQLIPTIIPFQYILPSVPLQKKFVLEPVTLLQILYATISECQNIVSYLFQVPNHFTSLNWLYYCKVSHVRRTLVGNEIVDNSDVVGASPVGAATTTSET